MWDLVPWPGLLHWECDVLPTEPPEEFLHSLFKKASHQTCLLLPYHHCLLFCPQLSVLVPKPLSACLWCNHFLVFSTFFFLTLFYFTILYWFCHTLVFSTFCLGFDFLESAELVTIGPFTLQILTFCCCFLLSCSLSCWCMPFPKFLQWNFGRKKKYCSICHFAQNIDLL